MYIIILYKSNNTVIDRKNQCFYKCKDSEKVKKELDITKRLLIVTACVDLISAILAVVWLINPAIINPDFSSAIRTLFAETGFIVDVMSKFNYFFLGCIIFALAVDFATVGWKYYKSNK